MIKSALAESRSIVVIFLTQSPKANAPLCELPAVLHARPQDALDFAKPRSTAMVVCEGSPAASASVPERNTSFEAAPRMSTKPLFCREGHQYRCGVP